MRPFGFILMMLAWASPLHADPPNVLMIIVDDLRDWVGCMGAYSGPSPTPNIDRLAARGMLFTRAYAAAPLCNPSRVAVLTGLRPSTTGVYHNDQWWRPALPRVQTLPEHFKAHGYEVVGAGKTTHHMPGFNPPQQWHRYFKQVFDDPYHRPAGYAIHPLTGTRWPDGFPLNGLAAQVRDWPAPFNPREFDWGPVDKVDAQMGDGRMAQWVADDLSRKHDRPFLMIAGTFKPHLPWYAPRSYFDATPIESVAPPALKADDLSDVPPAGVAMARVSTPEVQLLHRTGDYRQAVRAYLAAIRFADAQVGRMIDALERGPHAGDTLVVLWSDHGWHLGEKDHWLKSTLWEPATRVPLIVTGPGVAAGARCDRTVGLIDLYPTLLEWCGLPAPKQTLDGTSLAPLLREPKAPWDRPAVTTYLRGNHAVRDERWRYIRYADGSEELYDHSTDPNEWTNLAGSSECRPVKQRLAAGLPRVDAPDVAPKEAYDFHFDTHTWTRKGKP